MTDNLGGYDFNGTTVYPLTYEAGSVALFTNGVPQAAPTVVAGPPLVFSNITVPAGGDVVIVYQAQVLALSLLVLGVFANYHNATLALDDLTLFAHGFNGRSYLHTV